MKTHTKHDRILKIGRMQASFYRILKNIRNPQFNNKSMINLANKCNHRSMHFAQILKQNQSHTLD